MNANRESAQGVRDFDQILRRQRRGLLDVSGIKSKRLVALFDKAWKRLPLVDRGILRYLIGEVTDGETMVRDAHREVGSVSHYMGEVLIGGVGCMLPDNTLCFLNDQNMAGLSDQAVMAVIAHELAHIILRHASLTHPFTVTDELNKEVLVKLHEVHEWEAHLQAWMWGFSVELRCLWSENKMVPPPWYHQYEES